MTMRRRLSPALALAALALAAGCAGPNLEPYRRACATAGAGKIGPATVAEIEDCARIHAQTDIDAGRASPGFSAVDALAILGGGLAAGAAAAPRQPVYAPPVYTPPPPRVPVSCRTRMVGRTAYTDCL